MNKYDCDTFEERGIDAVDGNLLLRLFVVGEAEDVEAFARQLDRDLADERHRVAARPERPDHETIVRARGYVTD